MVRVSRTDIAPHLRPERREREPCPKCGKKNCECVENLLFWQIERRGLLIPARQYRWHPTREFRADFAYPQAYLRLLIQVQGGTWVGRGHGQGSGIERDAEWACEAAIYGWYLLPVTSSMVRTGDAVDRIERALKMRGVTDGEPQPMQLTFGYPPH
jgi:hypothetical protein